MDVKTGRSRSSSSFTADNAFACVRSVVSNGKSTIANASTFGKLLAPNSSSVREDRSSHQRRQEFTSNEELSASAEGAGLENETGHRREVCA